MELAIKEIVDKKEKATIAQDILNDLPEWFGMPESTKKYVEDSQDKPFLACFIHGDTRVFIYRSSFSAYVPQGHALDSCGCR